MDLQGVSKRIRGLRGNLSQPEFGKLINVTQTYVSQIETETIKPSIEVLVAISNQCGKSIDYILHGKEFEINPRGLNISFVNFDLETRNGRANEALQLLDSGMKNLSRCAVAIRRLDEDNSNRYEKLQTELFNFQASIPTIKLAS